MRIFFWVIKFYQLAVSPYLPSTCRFTPTCSEYTQEAMHRHGFIKGTLMGLKRLSRCRPLSGTGYDPPPQNNEI